MGTNFYVKQKRCKTCGHQAEASIHLGKSSHGWQFTFQYNGGRWYKNVEEMKKWLKSKHIEDEYGTTIPYNVFWQLVEEKQTKEKRNHAKEYPSNRDFMIDGYSFSDCEFS